MSAKRVVAIAGSAGSLEALRAIVPALPAGFPLAVIVVVHQHRHAGPWLVDHLARLGALAATTIEDKLPVEPARIHVGPANYHVLIEAGDRFALSVDEPVHAARPSLDLFLESAARAWGPAVVGVLLSGATADGAAGLAAIEARGGEVICQDPHSARAPTMPAAGIASTRAARIAAPEHIGTTIREVAT